MRRLLCGILLSLACLSGAATADDAPRIITLSWEATEHLLKLGITPVAAADAGDYRAWVVRPTLPDSVPSIGSRTEPNLEAMAALAPDLIVINEGLKDIRPTLERIAPVVTYEGFRRQADNGAVQRQNFLALAGRLGRSERARQALDASDRHIDAMRQTLLDHFGGRLPEVTVIRFSSPTAVYINTANSMVQEAMNLLGLPSGYPLEASAWGIVQVPIATLGNVHDGIVLHIEPFAQQAQLFATPLWQAMPFVQDGHFGAMRSTWSYGGAFSVEYLADAITQALLKIDGTGSGLARAD